MRLKRWANALLDLIFPPRCVICRKLTEGGADICPDCARKLEPTGSQVKQSVPFCDRCYSPFFYAEPLRGSFLRYKFSGAQHYAAAYGRWMADCLTAQEATQFDFITWAPLSRLRRWRRGYDQAEELAREIGQRLGLPVKATLKKAHRKPLSRLSGDRSARAARIFGAYSVRRGAAVAGKHILLVDDIVTSGATLSECARILKTAGAAQITCVTLARRHKED